MVGMMSTFSLKLSTTVPRPPSPAAPGARTFSGT
jgi:hypothetical protein